jgi:hypothetical protein
MRFLGVLAIFQSARWQWDGNPEKVWTFLTN